MEIYLNYVSYDLVLFFYSNNYGRFFVYRQKCVHKYTRQNETVFACRTLARTSINGMLYRRHGGEQRYRQQRVRHPRVSRDPLVHQNRPHRTRVHRRGRSISTRGSVFVVYAHEILHTEIATEA